MKKFKSFTLIEIIITIGIVAVLLAIASGSYNLIMFKTRESKTKALIKKLEMAMRSYRHETGYYFQQSDGSYGPLTINESDTEFTRLIDYTKMLGKNEINDNNNVVDAWDNEIGYECPGDINTTLFDIGSKGPNAVWGDSVDDDTQFFGSNDDITNTNM